MGQFVQRDRALGGGPAVRGIVQFDPRTGTFTSVLPLRPPKALRWTEMLDFTHATGCCYVAVTDGPMGGVAALGSLSVFFF